MDSTIDGSWLRAKGSLTLEPLNLDVKVELDRLALARLAPAVRASAPILVEDGRLGRRRACGWRSATAPRRSSPKARRCGYRT